MRDFTVLTKRPCHKPVFIFLGIPRALTAKESVHLEKVESKVWLNYLEQVVEMFRGEIPHVKHPKLDYAEFKQTQKTTTMADFSQLQRFALNKKAAEAAWAQKASERSEFCDEMSLN
jgi:hypothetical protein